MEYFNLHTHYINLDKDTLSVVNFYPFEEIPENIYFSTGIHPWKINENWEKELNVIRERLDNKFCLALGECGLDKKIEIPLEIQINVFQAQVLLAKEKQKQLIIHCVAAFYEVLKILKENKFNQPVVFHGFSKNLTIANQLIKNGYFITFGKYLIQNEEIMKVFENIDNSFFFLETDNSSYDIKEVYKKATELKKISEIELKSIVNQNFTKIFKI